MGPQSPRHSKECLGWGSSRAGRHRNHRERDSLNWRGGSGVGKATSLQELGPPPHHIRPYKDKKDGIEKTAEVYTRLKSRVPRPKTEAIQKANKTGKEKEKAEAEKAEEKLAGEDAPKEKVEEEPSTGEGWDGPLSPTRPTTEAVPAGDSSRPS
ncbi:Hypothetical predicted protein, partial [Marmota monax]